MVAEKNLKKFDLISEIYGRLFGYFNGYEIEKELNTEINPACEGNREKVDITKTSGNLDFKVSTYQSMGENVYFNISLFDYDTKEDHPTGYFYIKNYTGEIGETELKALSYIIKAGNQITKEIFETIR